MWTSTFFATVNPSLPRRPAQRERGRSSLTCFKTFRHLPILALHTRHNKENILSGSLCPSAPTAKTMDTVCKRSAACRCPDCAAASAAFSIDDLRALAPSRSVYDDDDNGDTSNPPPPSRPVCASPSGAAPPPVPGRHPRRHQGADPVKTEGEAVAVPYPTRKGETRKDVKMHPVFPRDAPNGCPQAG